MTGNGTTIPRSNIGVPDVGYGVALRPRPIGMLIAAVKQSRLVHVVAPAGAGKTTLVAQAMAEIDAPKAWLTLEHWDRRPERFVRDLGLSIGAAVPAVNAAREQWLTEEPGEVASSMGTVLGDREFVLVIDNAHLLDEWGPTAEVLAALVHARNPGTRLILVERFAPVIPGIGAAVAAASSTIGDDVIRADLGEAEAIVAARGFDVDPAVALESSGGWIAGLVLEPGRGDPSARGRLATYLATDVRPRLTPAEETFLMRCAVFDHIDRQRAMVIGGDAGPAYVEALRRAGIPGVWDERGQDLRMHPQIREVLKAGLERASADDRRAAWTSAAAVYEREGETGLALDALLEAGDLDAARRLLPPVIMEVIQRLDVEEAERLLAAVPMDPEPPEVMYARLCLALVQQAAAKALPVLAALERDGNGADVFAKVPEAGAIVVLMYEAIGKLPNAFAALEQIPPGRSYDTARLLLSEECDDPDAPIPPLVGDMLDALIARGMYRRGQIGELLTIRSTTLAAMSGVPDLADRAPSRGGILGRRLARIRRAVAARDLAAAQAVIAEFEAMPWTNIFIGLCEAEIAVRIERSGERALRGLAHACALPEAENIGYRQLIDMWRGAALLLLDDPRAAAVELTRAVETMRGGRLLMLPTALVYLAEARWQLGDEVEADRLTAEAYSIARSNGDLGRLILALADFPGVLSRALDLESESDSTWHALGRALVTTRFTSSPVGTARVHLREFGEPTLVIDGIAVRPKIRKSLEVASFLVSHRDATARRADILDALWGGRDDDASRAYLRQAVRHLREVLPQGAEIVTEGSALSLVGAFTSETTEFKELRNAAAAGTGRIRRSLLTEALAIVRRGVFLEGTHDVRWVDERRDEIATWRVEALLDVAETFLDENLVLDVLDLVDEALTLDRPVERAWRLRMQALALLGDQDGVVDAFRACGEALGDVGLPISRGTRELAQRLRA